MAFAPGELDRLHSLFGDDIGPYGRVSSPPFFAPIPTSDIQRYVLKPGASAELDIGPGWILSAFSTSNRDNDRCAVFGWVRGLLAIDERHDCGAQGCAVLSHLPTGYRILEANTAEDAALAAALIFDCVDWSVVLTNVNGAMRCRAPGCGADASFGFGVGSRSCTWFCLAHRGLGAEVLRGRP